MLKQLLIRNVALVLELTVCFDRGLNVLTGETGAGKSIIVDSVNFLIGARADKDMIRSGAEKAYVEGVFDISDNQAALNFLSQNDMEADDGCIFISRELNTAGRSVCRIGGMAVNLSLLKTFASSLIDIHGQHEHQSLLHSSVHLALLDKFAKQDALVQKVRASYDKMQAVQARLNEAALSEQEKARLRDMCAYQLKEIEDVHPTQEEDDQLEQTLPKMKHSGKLLELAETAYNDLYEGEGSATERAGKAARCLEDMAELDDSLAELSQNLNSALAALEDAANTLATYKQKKSWIL